VANGLSAKQISYFPLGLGFALQINVIDGRKPDRMMDAARQTEAA
jgi:hypothetical protein